MKKEFIKRVFSEGIVDTRNYRYTSREVVDYEVPQQCLEIVRLPVSALGTTEAIDGWEVVKVLVSSGAATTNKRR